MSGPTNILPRLRWQIMLLVAVAISLSYLDRQTLPVAIKAIEQDIPINNQQFALLQTAFLFTYAIMYAVGGRLIDLLGSRRGFVLVMVFWSLACAGHGLAASFGVLATFRLLLGAGEGGGFPAATRVMAEWVPMKDRTMAMGIINTGSALGMIVAPLLITGILSLASWRWIFFVAGGLGLLWTGWWLVRYRSPETHPGLNQAERQELQTLTAGGPTDAPPGWLILLRMRETWGLLTAKFLSDGAWYFYLFWLPKYLYDSRHLDIKTVAGFVWMPPLAAGIGSFFGGWFASWLMHRHLSLNAGRKIALAVSAALMPAVLLVSTAPLAWAMAIFCLAYLGHQFWATILMTLPADLYPKHAVGTIAGLMGCAGGFGGVAFGELAGWLLDHGPGWPMVFALGGMMHVLSFGLLCAFLPQLRPVSLPVAPATT
jgi:MFS transporter, ACS family, hexuronate transporter